MAHGGQELTWDSGSENPGVIKWAAFYSDCEHEVMEVTSGHVRIPVTRPSQMCPLQIQNCGLCASRGGTLTLNSLSARHSDL